MAREYLVGGECPSCGGLGYHPPFTFDQDQDVEIPCGQCGQMPQIERYREHKTQGQVDAEVSLDADMDMDYQDPHGD